MKSLLRKPRPKLARLFKVHALRLRRNDCARQLSVSIPPMMREQNRVRPIHRAIDRHRFTA